MSFLRTRAASGCLAVQVEMAERARRHEKIRTLLLRFDDVIAAHRERLLSIEREHRKAATFRCAAIFDRFGAEQRNEPLEIGFALGALLQTK